MADDARQLLLQVDAQVELARRNLGSLERDVSRFQRNADASLSKLDSSFGRVGEAAAFLKGGLIGLVSGIGLQGFISAGRAVLQFADDLEAAADQANIGVERYQTLKEGLRALEVDAEQADRIFKTLSDTLGAVQSGTAAEGVVDVLERMGVRSRILSGDIATTDELLDAIAASTNKFGSEAEFTAGIVDLVGRKVGVDLAAALRDGGAALKEHESRFREAGSVISEEYIARLSAANEKIDQFVTNSKSKLTIWAAETIGFFEQVDDRVAPIISRILNAFDAAAGVDMPSGQPKPVSRAQRMANDQRGLDALRPGSAAYEALYQRFLQDYGQDPVITVSGRRTRPTFAPPGKDTAKPASTARNRPREFNPFFTTNVDGVSADLARAFETRFDQDPLIAAMLEEKGGKTIDDRLAEIDAVESAEIAAIKKVREANAEARAEAEKFYDNVSRNLSQAIVYGQDLGEALVNSFKAAAAEALASGLFDFLKGGGGGGAGGLIKSIGAAFGYGAAGGGELAPGRINVVGERGWELAVPKAPTSILNQAQLRALGVGGGGGGGSAPGISVHQHFHNRFDVGLESVDTRIAQAAPILGRQAVAGVKDAMRRRGPWR